MGLTSSSGLMDAYLSPNGKGFHCAILSAAPQLVLTWVFRELSDVLVQTKAAVQRLGSEAVDLTKMTGRKRSYKSRV